jgi:hypothetical protein
LEGTKEFYEIAKNRKYDNLFQMFKSDNVADLSQKIYDWLIVSFDNKNGHEYIEKYYSSVVHCEKIMNIMMHYVNKYQPKIEPSKCSEIINFTSHIVASNNIINKIDTLCGKEIDHDVFARIIFNVEKDVPKYKRFEVLLMSKNIITPIPIGYQFDVISPISTAYSMDTVTIANNGIKSICSSELDLTNTKTIQINLRPNEGHLMIDNIRIIGYL